MDPLKDRETKESGCSWQKSSLTFGCARHKLMTHYVHTGTVRDRVARQASRYDRENEAVLLCWHTYVNVFGRRQLCQTLRIICQYDPSAETKTIASVRTALKRSDNDEMSQARKTGLSPPLVLYWPFQGGSSVVVPHCSCCLYLYFGSAIMLVTYFVNFR